MHKNALFFEKKNIGKLPQRWGLRSQTLVGIRRLEAPHPDPRVITLISCYSYFLEGVCSANVITVKKEQRELRNSNNVLLLPLISYFKLCAGYLSKRHWRRFLGIITNTAYIISCLSNE